MPKWIFPECCDCPKAASRSYYRVGSESIQSRRTTLQLPPEPLSQVRSITFGHGRAREDVPGSIGRRSLERRSVVAQPVASAHSVTESRLSMTAQQRALQEREGEQQAQEHEPASTQARDHEFEVHQEGEADQGFESHQLACSSVADTPDQGRGDSAQPGQSGEVERAVNSSVPTPPCPHLEVVPPIPLDHHTQKLSHSSAGPTPIVDYNVETGMLSFPHPVPPTIVPLSPTSSQVQHTANAYAFVDTSMFNPEWVSIPTPLELEREYREFADVCSGKFYSRERATAEGLEQLPLEFYANPKAPFVDGEVRPSMFTKFDPDRGNAGGGSWCQPGQFAHSWSFNVGLGRGEMGLNERPVNQGDHCQQPEHLKFADQGEEQHDIISVQPAQGEQQVQHGGGEWFNHHLSYMHPDDHLNAHAGDVQHTRQLQASGDMAQRFQYTTNHHIQNSQWQFHSVGDISTAPPLPLEGDESLSPNHQSQLSFNPNQQLTQAGKNAWYPYSEPTVDSKKGEQEEVIVW
eukprot:GHVN01083536.1.p1 GENE.GHVN01083536.1~~GHVN01083536.1.p1  ORF type:complete len:534 (+),score=95.95 GHVN01083536.1:51-1604(+)